MSPLTFLLQQKSFKRKIPYDWSRYTHLVMRVRGDGRPYMLNIMMDQFFDVNWFDQYNYILFTRGGPYWQVAKVSVNSAIIFVSLTRF